MVCVNCTQPHMSSDHVEGLGTTVPHTFPECYIYIFFFYRPKSDTCKTCDSLNVRISAEEDSSAKRALETERKLHHCKAERAYQQLKEDTALSQLSQDVDTINFDLQQSLPTPKLATNVVFYKCQMWTYNLGVHDCSSGKGFMFMWPESVASRGSQEVCSCVFKYLRMRESETSHLMVYSDACGGQNRNINVACMWMHIVASTDFKYTIIEHKFMISGHSYLPNDRDFGSIEKANRRIQHIFVPDDWCTLVEKLEGTTHSMSLKWQLKISSRSRMFDL